MVGVGMVGEFGPESSGELVALTPQERVLFACCAVCRVPFPCFLYLFTQIRQL